jgi:hypothetical protein
VGGGSVINNFQQNAEKLQFRAEIKYHNAESRERGYKNIGMLAE